MPEIKTDRLHEWISSTLGHGDAMCRWCLITNREAAVIGLLNKCNAKQPEQDTPYAP